MNEDIYAAAVRWHQAQGDEAMDWAGFTTWLADDGRHRVAYDEIALLDDRIDHAVPVLARLIPVDPIRTTRRNVHPATWGAAAAAVVVGAIGIGVIARDRGPVAAPSVQASAGALPRSMTLAAGSRVTLSPGTTLRSSPGGGALQLEGQAYFDVRHDPANPLTIRAAGYTIRDVGTRFEVTTGPGMMRVAVAEGVVVVGRAGVAGEVRVVAGRSLTAMTEARSVDMGIVAPAAVGRRSPAGLVYDDMPLALVAADLARHAGRPITVAQPVARRRFSGVIRLGSAEAMAEALARLTGLHVRRTGNALLLAASAGT